MYNGLIGAACGWIYLGSRIYYTFKYNSTGGYEAASPTLKLNVLLVSILSYCSFSYFWDLSKNVFMVK